MDTRTLGTHGPAVTGLRLLSADALDLLRSWAAGASDPAEGADAPTSAR